MLREINKASVISVLLVALQGIQLEGMRVPDRGNSMYKNVGEEGSYFLGPMAY